MKENKTVNLVSKNSFRSLEIHITTGARRRGAYVGSCPHESCVSYSDLLCFLIKLD